MVGRPVEKVLSSLTHVRNLPAGGWMARCPAHEDRTPSLKVDETDEGNVLLFCHAGCEHNALLSAMGLNDADLFASNGHGTPGEIEAEYTYTDESGESLFVVERHTGKRFLQRRPSGQYGIRDVRQVLFHLPKVLQAKKEDRTIYVVEGEKDVLAVERAGAIATTNPGGAGKWRDEYSEVLRGALVVVVRDRDTAGHAHAKQVVASLRAHGAPTVTLKEPAEGKDVYDHLASGLDLEDLVIVADTKQLRSVLARDIKAQPVRWLWKDWVALEMLNVLAGPQGTGKSTILYDLTARVTREGVVVLIATAEDHLAAVVRPRLEAAGADLAKVRIITGIGEKGMLLPADVGELSRAAESFGAALVTVDPLVAFLGGEVNTHRDASVRQALAPLGRLAESVGCAVVCVLHTNKANSDDPLFRISGSGAFSAAARHVVLACPDPEDERGQRRFLAVVKSNLAQFPSPMEFEIVPSSIVDPDTGEVLETSRVEWGDERPEINPRELLRSPESTEERGALSEAVDFLRSELASAPRRAEELFGAAKRVGLSERTLKRAKSRLQVRAKPMKDELGRIAEWTWELPPGHTPQGPGGQPIHGPLGPVDLTSADVDSLSPAGPEGHDVGGGLGVDLGLGERRVYEGPPRDWARQDHDAAFTETWSMWRDRKWVRLPWGDGGTIGGSETSCLTYLSRVKSLAEFSRIQEQLKRLESAPA